MKWKDKLIKDVMNKLTLSNTSSIQLKSSFEAEQVSIHLAIFSEPFLSLLFNGKKKIESRFSVNNVIPYRKVFKNDIVLVKRTGGPILGVFFVKSVNYYSNLNPSKVEELEKLYSENACWNIDPEFLESKKVSNFLTIIEITSVHRIDPIEVDKSDRTAWAIIRPGFTNTLFDFKT
ncbi:hypothetical protein [Chitinophaga sp. GbtcB8]|uniref:hypothetical protein n=1 Tax=Chitinophaga sp. GbtcB8 TaxID=2824753 RepID=UPI001C2F68F5|nr:hypothetical protein [Chitinophaga sp. GbtcB8]